ncbi:hypothetical protein BH09BAC2_BH09BAC2_00930 [soil metagenome]
MRICVLCNTSQQNEILEKKISETHRLDFIQSTDELKYYDNADIFFLLSEEIGEFKTTKPVFYNNVILPHRAAKKPGNFHRINGWPTFLKRDVWEVSSENIDEVDRSLGELGFKYLQTEDTPGFVAARVISMIINEAYFAFEENVSSKADINTAMKLGTNYPFGPFEWAEMIGLDKIYSLLTKLELTDNRYKPSKALIAEAINQ